MKPTELFQLACNLVDEYKKTSMEEVTRLRLSYPTTSYAWVNKTIHEHLDKATACLFIEKLLNAHVDAIKYVIDDKE